MACDKLCIRYKGKWFQSLYFMYVVFVEFTVVTNEVTISIRFLASNAGVIERCIIIFPLTSISLGLFRMWYFSLRRPRFVSLIKGYDSVYKGSPNLNADIDQTAKILRFIPRFMVLMTALPMSPWCFLPILNASLGGPWVISVPSSWPFDPVSNIYYFSAVSTIQSFCACFSTLRVVLFDNIFSVYACRQLALIRELKRELERILSASKIDGSKVTDEIRMNISCRMTKELKRWVINHQVSLRLGVELQDLFSPCLALQFSMISIGCCTTAFYAVFLKADLLNITLCLLYAIGNSLALLIACRLGDLITNESDELEHAVDGSRLHLMAPDIYKQWLRMILYRSRKPLRISAFGIFPLNTETFKNVMGTTYSFFTLLVHMKDRQE